MDILELKREYEEVKERIENIRRSLWHRKTSKYY